MAWSHVGSTQGTGNNPTSGSLTTPGSPQAGDLVILWLYSRAGVYNASWDQGTNKHSSGNGTNGRLVINYLYYNSESSFSFTRSAASSNSTTVYGVDIFRGAFGSGDPFEADTGATPSTATTQNPDPPSVTASSTDAAIWAIGGKRDDAAGSITAPTNYTLGANADSLDGADAAAAAIYRFNVTGAQDPGAITMGGTSADALSWSGALKPAAGSPDPITGTGAITAAAHTISGSGKLSFRGTAAVTVAAHSVAGTGKLSFVATGAITAAPATLAATGKLSFVATGAITAAAHTISGTGESAATGITGSGAITAAAHTVAATGKQSFRATGSITAAPHAVAGAGKLSFRATGTITAAAPLLSGTGSLAMRGTGAVTAGAHSVSGSGTLRFIGTATISAAPHSISGSGNSTVVIEGVAVVSDSAFGAAIVITAEVHQADVEDVNYYRAIVSDEG